MHESDLLAFEIGLKHWQAGRGDGRSYNSINGDYACENKYTLTDVLRDEWKFPGFVVSDWGGTHSTVRASHAGLDIEEPGEDYFGAKLKTAVENGDVSQAELDSHVLHVLRSEFMSGIIDYPQIQKKLWWMWKQASRRRASSRSRSLAVLLQNKNSILAAKRFQRIKSIAVVGKNADMGMISGGGSAQVDPMGAAAPKWQQVVWFPTSPLKAISNKAPGTKVSFELRMKRRCSRAAAVNWRSNSGHCDCVCVPVVEREGWT